MLSKIAIILVVGFFMFQFINKKTGMHSSTSMQSITTPSPLEYGAPIPSAGPLTAYESSTTGWETTNNKYSSRVWEPLFLGSSHELPYKAYYNPSGKAAKTFGENSYNLQDTISSSSISTSLNQNSSVKAEAY